MTLIPQYRWIRAYLFFYHLDVPTFWFSLELLRSGLHLIVGLFLFHLPNTYHVIFWCFLFTVLISYFRILIGFLRTFCIDRVYIHEDGSRHVVNLYAEGAVK